MWKQLQWNVVTWWRLVLWNIAVLTYVPPWCLGNRFQQWIYKQNDRLREWLTLQMEIDIKDAEQLLKDAEATDDD